MRLLLWKWVSLFNARLVCFRLYIWYLGISLSIQWRADVLLSDHVYICDFIELYVHRTNIYKPSILTISVSLSMPQWVDCLPVIIQAHPPDSVTAVRSSMIARMDVYRWTDILPKCIKVINNGNRGLGTRIRTWSEMSQHHLGELWISKKTHLQRQPSEQPSDTHW